MRRTIGRMKNAYTFEMLTLLRSNPDLHIDQILIVIAFICNCQPDLIKR